jgi:hypothetical protein
MKLKTLWLIGLVGLMALGLFVTLPASAKDGVVSFAGNSSKEDAPSVTTSLYLPMVMNRYLAPAPLWRFGTTPARQIFTSYNQADIAAMRFGWYLNFGADANPAQPYGMEYMPMVRMKQLKVGAGGIPTECCVGCQYVSPYTYTASPNASQVQSIASSRPGMTWLIGNEMERIDWGQGYCARQDETLPELYAQIYHDYYYAIKAADPTAQVAIGGVVEATPLRLQYLQRVWDAYQSTYASPMPVDVWNIHVHVLNEQKNGWGADIPAGINATQGMLYQITDNRDFNKAWVQVQAMRQWMKDHGQQNKPLITTEYGVLMPSWQDPPGYFSVQNVRDYFMYPSFNAFLNATDANIGYPADGNRLMQRWNWWSLDYDEGYWDNGAYYDWNSGYLFYSGLPPTDKSGPAAYTKGVAPLGTYWKQYVQGLPSAFARPYAPVAPAKDVQKLGAVPALPVAAAPSNCYTGAAARDLVSKSLPTGLSSEAASARLAVLSKLTGGTQVCVQTAGR